MKLYLFSSKFHQNRIFFYGFDHDESSVVSLAVVVYFQLYSITRFVREKQ